MNGESEKSRSMPMPPSGPGGPPQAQLFSSKLYAKYGEGTDPALAPAPVLRTLPSTID